MIIDMWHGNKFEPKKYKADAYFNDLSCKYYGWIYNENNKIIGDYTASNSIEIENNFQIEWRS